MINILIVADQPQRFLDQLKFANLLFSKDKNLCVKFFVSNVVYQKYKNIIESLSFEIINKADLVTLI